MTMSRHKHLLLAATLACVYLLAAGPALANDIVVNGDFESGNVDFTSDYICNPLSSPSVDPDISTFQGSNHSKVCASKPEEGEMHTKRV